MAERMETRATWCNLPAPARSLKQLDVWNYEPFLSPPHDPDTPRWKETVGTFGQMYCEAESTVCRDAAQLRRETMKRAAAAILSLHCPFIISKIPTISLAILHWENGVLKQAVQPDGEEENLFLSALSRTGVMLTNRYLNGIPKGNRVNTDGRFPAYGSVWWKADGKYRRPEWPGGCPWWPRRWHSMGDPGRWLLPFWSGASRPAQILENLKVLNSALVYGGGTEKLMSVFFSLTGKTKKPRIFYFQGLSFLCLLYLFDF